ncbi:MAG: O-antigen ligase family protein [Blastocatellia bacterium]
MGNQPRPVRSFLNNLSYFSPDAHGFAVRLADGVLLGGLALFAILVPHSIAGAWISFGLCMLAWGARDLAAGQIRLTRLPCDRPILAFASLSLVSALWSADRDISLPKLFGLLLFLVVYLIATNVTTAGARALATLLLVSALAGVGFSLWEKIAGRGMTVLEIRPGSPLAASGLQKGDVIWMVARKRVRSLGQLESVIRAQPAGKKLELEVLHEGDPLPVSLLVTEELKNKTDLAGLVVGAGTRRFRISGFSRNFITYSEQMLLLALFAWGFVVAGFRGFRGFGGFGVRGTFARRLIAALAFLFLSLALALTSARAPIVAMLLALGMVSVFAGGRRIIVPALLVALALGFFSWQALLLTRTEKAGSFTDDSAKRRMGYLLAGARMIPRHPLLGVGMDAHKRHWREWEFPGDYITHTHSTPVQIAMDRGLPALGCYGWFLFSLFAALLRRYREIRQSGDFMDQGICLGVTGALTGFSLNSLVNYSFGDSEIVALLLLLAGLVFTGARAGQGRN